MNSRQRRRKRRHQTQDGCAGKKRYGSYDEAALALVEAKIASALRGNPRRREERQYWCWRCSGHHLTSRPEPARGRGASA